MSKILRGAILLLAIVMMTGTINQSTSSMMMILKIISIALLLMAMESVRRKGDRLYSAQSDIVTIDEMSEGQFKEYTMQLYKKLGYYVQVNRDFKKYPYDFLVIKNRKIQIIKCIKHSSEMTLEQFREMVVCIRKQKLTNLLIITSEVIAQEIIECTEWKDIEFIQRPQLMKLIEQIVKADYETKTTRKVQET